MKKKILINASNIRVGGGVQVATSIIDQVSNDAEFLDFFEVKFLVSRKVFENISKTNNVDLKIKDWYFKDLFNPLYLNLFKSFDLVLNIFGPIYHIRKNIKTITGFALPGMLEKNFGLHYRIKKLFFNHNEHLIIEHDWFKLRVRELFHKNKISIINNSLNGIFFNKSNQVKFSFPDILHEKKLDGYCAFYFLGRMYEHKNIPKLVQMFNILEEKKIKCFLVLTLNDDEEKKLNLKNSKNIFNLGVVEINELPDFINFFDSYISLSDKECFSIGPIEAIRMKKRVFLNDRVFFRQTIKNHAIYLESNDIEYSVNTLIKNLNYNIEKSNFIDEFDPLIKWNQYKEIILNEL